MEPLRIAVIGSGYWGRKVIREIINVGQTTGQIQLHAVVDSSPSSLSQCQQEFGSGLQYRLDYHDLLQDPALSSVHISTPNATHFEIASRFLRAGKNVLVEKPLTLRTMESYELVRLAAENRAVLSVGHIHRFNNGVRELRRIVTEGRLGDIFYADFRWTGLLVPQLQREVITDLAPHPFDICNYVLDMWPEKISCKAHGYRTRQNEEVAFITAEHKNGILAHIEVSWLDRSKRRDVIIVGSQGMAHLDCITQQLTLQSSEGSTLIPVLPSNTLASEIAHFADCVKNNRDIGAFSNHSDGMLGARVVALLEASRDSIYNDRSVSVQLPIIPEIPVRQ